MHPIEHLRYIARAHGADPAALVEETAHALGSLYVDPAGVVVSCRRIVERHPFTGPLWWLCANVVASQDAHERVWELADEARTDRTPRHFAEALPDDADIVTVGAPSQVAPALGRRGDVRVLALDVQHTATMFVRQLERRDIEYEPIDAGAAGAAVRTAGANGGIVAIEALAADADRIIAPIGSSTIAGLGAAFGVPVWLIAGLGRSLPSMFVDAMVNEIDRHLETSLAWDLDVEVLPTSLVTDVIRPSGRVPMGPPALQPDCPATADLLRKSPI